MSLSTASEKPTPSLPEEVWVLVLRLPCLSAKDVCHASTSCKLLHHAAAIPAVWLSKFLYSWPFLYHEIADLSPDGINIEDWRTLFVQRYTMAKDIRTLLMSLSEHFCHSANVHLNYVAFGDFEQLIANNNPFGSQFAVNALRSIVNDPDQHQNLTQRFYASRTLRFVLQEQLTQTLTQWIINVGHMEKGALVLAQWCQPTQQLSFRTIEQFCSDVVQDVLRQLKANKKTQKHPLLAAFGSDKFDDNITSSLWSAGLSLDVIKALNNVFVDVLGFHGDTNTYYQLQNSFLNKVIETHKGIPISLCVLYHAIARRLGVFCYFVSFPGHFLLKVEADDERVGEFVYLDVFNHCRMMTESETLTTFSQFVDNATTSRQYLAPVSAVQVLRRMLNNITSVDQRFEAVSPEMHASSIEMARIVTPQDDILKFLLVRCYLHMDINMDKVIKLMESVEPGDSDFVRAQKTHFTEVARARLLQTVVNDQKFLPKLRSDCTNSHVKYGVGLIMRHREYNYTCVISGWDNMCVASSTWKQRMGVQNLTRSDSQPFYSVLVNDGSNRYAAEDNLIFEPNPVEINHAEVGKFFQEFCGTYYKMNPVKAAMYPEDSDFVLCYVRDNYGL